MAITYHSGERIQGLAIDRTSTKPTIDTTTSVGNTIISFKGNSTFTPTSAFNVEYLVIGGGGAAAYDRGGGGGAGAFRTATGFAVTAQAYTITVGAGGTGGTGSSGATNGESSIFSTITSDGGGYGSTNGRCASGYAGNGSGGGGNWECATPGTGGTYGYSGGVGQTADGATYPGGGGGGSSAVGATTTNDIGGDGGAGTANPITGSTAGHLVSGTYYFSGGGAGGRNGGAPIAVGGNGGGGNAATTTTTNGVAGAVNTGGGGGSALGPGGGNGGSGGSGIVIIKFATSGNTYTVGGLEDVPDYTRFEETDTRKIYSRLPATMSTTGLKAYYKFDEASGTVINKSNGADTVGTAGDGVVTGATQSATGGLIGGNIDFGGDGDKVTFGTVKATFNEIYSSTATWTINLWLKTTTIQGDAVILDSSGASGSVTGFFLRFEGSGGSLGFFSRDGSTEIADSGVTSIQLSTGSWEMVTITFDYNASAGTQLGIRINDGTPETDGVTTLGSNSNPTYDLTLGAPASGTDNKYNGKADEFSFWNRVLTDAEITALYNSGSGKAISSASWKEKGQN